MSQVKADSYAGDRLKNRGIGTSINRTLEGEASMLEQHLVLLPRALRAPVSTRSRWRVPRVAWAGFDSRSFHFGVHPTITRFGTDIGMQHATAHQSFPQH